MKTFHSYSQRRTLEDKVSMLETNMESMISSVAKRMEVLETRFDAFQKLSPKMQSGGFNTKSNFDNSTLRNNKLFWTESKAVHVQKNVNPKKDEDIAPLHHRFADSVTGIIGIKEIVSSKHPSVKYTWAILFMLGIGATAFFTYKTTVEYLEEPTATKIKMIDAAQYEYPLIALCPDAWIDVEKALSLGLTLSGLKYSLGYINDDTQLENVTEGRIDFLTFFTKHNFTSLVEYYKTIAIDIPTIYNQQEFDKLSTAILMYSDESLSLGKVFLDDSVCYAYKLKSADLIWTMTNTATAKSIDKSQGILKSSNSWSFEMILQENFSMAVNPGIHMPAFTLSKIVVTNKFISSISSEDSRCLATSEQEKNDATINYTMFSCMAERENREYRKTINCQLFQLTMADSTQAPTEYCHYFDTTESSNFSTLTEFFMSAEGVSMNRRIKDICKKDCPRRCKKNIFQSTLQWQKNLLMHENAKNRLEKIDKTNHSYIKINVDHAARYEGGVMSLMEVSTYSYADLVNNVGGTFGLFVGGTILTIAQLLLFFVDYLFEQRNERVTVVEHKKIVK